MQKMLNIFSFWDWVCFGAQLLLILLYASSVAAFVIGLKRYLPQLHSYFSGIFFLALCPFLCLLLAAAIRLYPIILRVDSIANAQQMLLYAIAPMFLGAATSFILVFVYSVSYARRSHSNQYA